MDRLITCPSCFELLANPRLLPCLHTFCLRCCQDLFDLAFEDGREPTCPSCGECVGTQAATQLPLNAAADDIDCKFTSNSCSKCEENEAASHSCTDCHMFLCPLHSVTHQKERGTNTHKLNMINNNAGVQPVCDQHPGQRRDVFCETCATTVCARCALSRHRTHSFLDLNSAALKCSGSLNEAVARLQSFLAPLNATLPDFEANLQMIRAREPVLVDHITTSFNSVITSLEQQRDSMVNEARSIISSHVKTLELQRDQVNVLLEVGETCLTQARAMTTKLRSEPTRMDEIFSMCSKVTNRMKAIQATTTPLKPLHYDTVRFESALSLTPSGLKVGHLQGMSGRVTCDWTNVGKSPTSAVAVIGNVGTQHQSQFSSPYGVAVTQTGLIVVADASKKLELLTVDGTHVRFLYCGTSVSSARHVAVSPLTGHIWVADMSGNRLHCFRENGSIVCKIFTPSPIGIAIGPSGDVYCTDTLNHKIRVFSPSGTLLREFGSRGSAMSQLKEPWGVAVFSSGNVVVADSANHRLQLFSPDGVFIRQIGNEQLSWPQGVMVTDDQMIVVTEGESHASVWSQEGQLVHSWGSRGCGRDSFAYPFGLAALPDGRFVIADHDNNRLLLFRL